MVVQLIFRLLFLLVDVGINSWILSNHQPFTIGTFTIGTDYGQSIILCNAAMIMVIYIADFIIVKLQRLFIDVHVGEKMIK